MKDLDQNRPADTATSAQTADNAEPSSSCNKRTALLLEIAALEQSGKDPGRLRSLRFQYDTERVRFIDKLLSTQQEDLFSRLRAQQLASLEALEWINQARERLDITVCEALQLANLYQHHTDVISETLLKEKALIEQRRRPNARTRNA